LYVDIITAVLIVLARPQSKKKGPPATYQGGPLQTKQADTGVAVRPQPPRT
jgi:hypothetical protein